MAPKQVLDQYQKRILELAARDEYLRTKFYLTGGTALAAFYLKHRRSYDLDFFTTQPIKLTEITRFMSDVVDDLKARPFTIQPIHDRYEFQLEIKKQPVKVEFVQYQFPQLQKARNFDGIAVDSLKDIAANKLFTTVERNEPKDLVDLAFILQEKFTVKALNRAVAQKFGFEIDRWHLLTIFERGSKLEFIEADLLRKPKIAFREFFTGELRKLGRQILVP